MSDNRSQYVCVCGHEKKWHREPTDFGGAQCWNCPEDGESMWKHPFTPKNIERHEKYAAAIRANWELDPDVVDELAEATMAVADEEIREQDREIAHLRADRKDDSVRAQVLRKEVDAGKVIIAELRRQLEDEAAAARVIRKELENSRVIIAELRKTVDEILSHNATLRRESNQLRRELRIAHSYRSDGDTHYDRMVKAVLNHAVSHMTLERDGASADVSEKAGLNRAIEVLNVMLNGETHE